MSPERLFKHFDQIVQAPDAIPRLRRFILDLAVRGKLVEQNPKEGSGSDFLETIRSKKENLMCERGIRREKDVEYSNPENEKDIPPSWTWAYIDDVAIVQGGKRLPKGASFSKAPTAHIYIRVTDMKNGTILEDGLQYITQEVQRSISRYIINQEDLYITIAGTIGQVGRVPAFFDGHNLTENAAKIVFRGLNSEYFQLALSSDLVQQQFRDKTKQLAQPKLALKRIAGAKFPFPPLAEQHRIVAKVDELMALCDKLEKAQAKRESRRDRLVASTLAGISAPQAESRGSKFFINHLPRITARPEHIKQLRQTILNLAVRGKLVPQDPKDEPATKLLKLIEAEKNQLINAGTLKILKTFLPISDKDKPFKLPQGWEWSRIQDVFLTVTDGDHQPPPKSEDGIPFLVIGNVRSGKVDFSGCRYVQEDYYKALDWISRPLKGDILYTLVGSYGIPVLLSDGRAFCVQRHIGILRPPKQVNAGFLTRALGSVLVFEQATSCATGIAQKTVPLNGLRKILIPLPPLAEQHRIVAKVDELMALCDELEARLNTTSTTRHQLLEATLHEALC